MRPQQRFAAFLSFTTPALAAVVPEMFQDQLRCPFAKVWLEHGAEKASQMLGVDLADHGGGAKRRLEDVAWGKCVWTNPLSGGAGCTELRGSWTDSAAEAHCAELFSGSVSGTPTVGARCDTSVAGFAGWCITEELEYTATDLHMGIASTCQEAEQACQVWMGGVYDFDGECAHLDGSETDDSLRCEIAPGTIGAAHQLGTAPGYALNCEGTPAQRSPYMWPLRWGADIEAKSMAFGSDDVVYESRGHVRYMLNKNWKRLDQWYQVGSQRAIGQGPCDTPGPDSMSCIRNITTNTSMIHRGSKMVFLELDDAGSITSCSWTDLGVVGNVRPDWFMDDRGDSTDVQYLGKSHVYYRGEPKLVRQWRKKDFANQYFTMSIQEHSHNGDHWPLILNVPGEGFGDDFLQMYSNHYLLNDNDEAAFLIDEVYTANGGSCPQIGQSGGGSGPPTSEQEHVPSNLEVEETAWRSIVFTGSPVWSPPPEEPQNSSTTSLADGMVSLADGVRAQYCWDSHVLALRVKMEIEADRFRSIPGIPIWVAAAFRETEECLMTPRGGGSSETILADPIFHGRYNLVHGPLRPEVKHFDDPDNLRSVILEEMSHVTEVEGITSSAAETDGVVSFSFSKTFGTPPWLMPAFINLSYAIGDHSILRYHASRGCFEVEVSSLSECDRSLCPPAFYDYYYIVSQRNTNTSQDVVEDGSYGEGDVDLAESMSTSMSRLSAVSLAAGIKLMSLFVALVVAH